MLPFGDFLSSTDSATAVAALFTRVDGTTKSSDFPSAFMSEVPSQRFADRSTPRRGDVETKGLSRFSRLECQHMHRFSDSAVSVDSSPILESPMWPSPGQN